MKIVVIGAGIAGLSAAIYASECGYDVEVLEAHERAGGLATNWERGGYTFENSLHWLLGSRPGSPMHARWRELFDIERLKFIYPEPFVRLEPAEGPALNVPRKVDQLEEEWLAYSPEDAEVTRRFAAQIRELGKVNVPGMETGRVSNWLGMLLNVPHLPLLHELTTMTCEEYGAGFKNPVMRSFFQGEETGRMSAIAVLLSLAWTSEGDCGYPIGGSQAVIRAMVERLLELGGKLHCNAKVVEIVAEDDAAVGVRLESGERIGADWVISGADGHATIFDLLHERFADRETLRVYEEFEPFPSYLQVSLGVGRELKSQAGFATWLLKYPMEIDPVTRATQLAMRFFHYDPTFAPQGSTAVTCVIPTRNSGYWMGLRQRDPERYGQKKQEIAESVMAEMERRIPGTRELIEVTDVASPATLVDCTGNWQGSMEGWLLTPHTGYQMLPNTLPGLSKFYMVGQWIMPGGGLPSGPLTARPAIEAICAHDHIPFTAGKKFQAA